MKKIIYIVLGIVISCSLQAATPELLFGPEFTFEMKSHADIKLYCDHLRKHLVTNQPQGEKFTYKFRTRREHFHPNSVLPPTFDLHANELYSCEFRSPNGWSFTAKPDIGVIEVTMRPMSVATAKKYASDIQDAIFVSAYNINRFPQAFAGGGHVNVGMLQLISQPMLLRNFLMDFYNHNELALGIFNYDTNNAIAFDLQNPIIKNKILAIFADFDRSMRTKVDTDLLLNEIEKIQSEDSDDYFKHWYPDEVSDQEDEDDTTFNVNLSRGSKGHALSLFWARVMLKDRDRRIEVRSVRPQKDFMTYINQIELLQERLKFLAKHNRAIPYRPQVQVFSDALTEPQNYLLNPPVDPQAALRAFYTYVSESGLLWSQHRGYVWPDWVNGDELNSFESSDWFQSRERNKESQVRKRSCEGFLSP